MPVRPWSLFCGPAWRLKFCVLPNATVAPPKLTVCDVADWIGAVERVTAPVATLMPPMAMVVFGAMPTPETICPTVSVAASAGASWITAEAVFSAVV